MVTQGASLDELLGNLREALELYMSDEDPAVLGLSPEPRLLISFEISESESPLRKPGSTARIDATQGVW